MSRLPTPGSDRGNWGSILNDYLSQSHNADGTIKDSIITESKLAQPVIDKINSTVAPTDQWVAALVNDSGSMTKRSLSSVFATVITPLLIPSDTPAQTLAKIQAAVTLATASGVGVRIPAGQWRIAGGYITLSSPITISGLGAQSTIHQKTFPLPIFKVTAPDVTIQDLALTGEGLDATGFPLFGDDSFRQHVGIWLDRSATRSTVRRIIGANLSMVVAVGDPRPGSGYGSSALKDAFIENISGTGVWCVIAGGFADGLTIAHITGQWGYFTGTPSAGDVGSPPHCVYISSDTDHWSSRVSISAVSASGNAAAAAGLLKVKHTVGLETAQITSIGGYGGAEFESVYDSTISGLQIFDDHYADTGGAYGRGAIWLVDCQRVTLDDPRVTFAPGTHGTGIYVESNCTDVTVRLPHITTNRSTATTNPVIAAKGVRTVIDRPVIRAAGTGQFEEAISAVGAGSRILNPDVVGTHLFGVHVEPAATPTVPICVEYDPITLLPSRLAGPNSLSVRFNTNATNTIIRNRSTGLIASGISDTFDRANSQSLGYTDDLKPWIAYGAGGTYAGSWCIDGNAARFNGGIPRSVIIADGGKADGTLTAVIGAVSAADEGIVIRASDANNYIAVVPYFGTGDYRVRLIKRVAGTASQIAVSTAAAVAGDTLAVIFAGNSISVNLNGSQIIAPQTVADFQTATKVGLLGSSGGMTFKVNSILYI